MTRPPEPPASDRPDDQDDRWDDLARYLAGEADPADAVRIERWLAEDPERRHLLEALDRSLDHARIEPPHDVDTEAALRRVHERIEQSDVLPFRAPAPERRAARRSTTLVRVAAAAALLLGGGLVYRALDRAPTAIAPAGGVTAHTTRVGEMDSLRLPDGTHVVLGPGSQLTVPAEYGDSARTVALTGEALFDVPHDETRPFSVLAGAAVILDLGTTFTVRSDMNRDEVRVVVTTGSVLLRADGAAEEDGVVLRARDRGVLARDGRPVAERGVATDDDVAWSSGRLIFRDTPIGDVAAELRRWFGITLDTSDPALAGRTVTATFEREDADQVLTVLELALGARIERRGDTAIVRMQ